MRHKTRKEVALPAFAGMAAIVAMISGFVSAAQINTNGKLEIKADDNTFSARVMGEMHYDGDFYKGGSDDRQLRSGTFMRRARLGVEGNFREYEYEVNLDFATNQATLENAYLRRIVGPGKVTLGQFKVFECLEQVTQSNEITFIERSYVASLAPGFKMGIGYNGTYGPLGFSGNVYNTREAGDANTGIRSADAGRPSDSGIGGVVRAYVAPVKERMMALHFGASYAHEYTDTIGARSRVEPLGRANKYINNLDPNIDGDSFQFVIFDRQDEHADINRFILETLAIDGPLSVQGEYMKGSAKTHTLGADTFSAWYAQLSYILTSEWRRYSFLTGEYKRPQPSRAAGAVEIAARYQKAKRDKVEGAELTATEFGVTYYANMNVRFMLNYGVAENKLINDKPRLLSFRGQFDF